MVTLVAARRKSENFSSEFLFRLDGSNAECIHTFNISMDNNGKNDQNEITQLICSKKPIAKNYLCSTGYEYDFFQIINRIGTYYPRLYRGTGSGDSINRRLLSDLYHQSASDISGQLRFIYGEILDIFSVLDQSPKNMNSFGPAIRSVLISSCIEFEYQTKEFLRSTKICQKNNMTTKHLFLAKNPLALSSYKINFPAFKNLGDFAPFSKWHVSSPTQSIPWFDAYNDVKHDRGNNASSGSLQMAIGAFAALLIVIEAQFGLIGNPADEFFTMDMARIKKRPHWLPSQQYHGGLQASWTEGSYPIPNDFITLY